MNRLTAKDFKQPVLEVLIDATNKDTSIFVKHKNLMASICAKKGVTLEQFGKDKNNVFWVKKWILWAFRELRNDGFTKAQGRGKWGITEAGLQSIDNTASTLPVKIVSESPKLDTELASQQHPYSDDPYIRSIAATQTECFGYYTDKSDTCKSCPITDNCKKAKNGVLASIAKELESMKESKLELKTLPNKNNATKLTLPHTVLCSKCGKTIQANEQAYWVESSTGGNAGIYHLGCYGNNN